MPNFNPSTQEMISFITGGLRVQTSVLANLSYLHQDQWEIFNVYGRIWVKQLYMEVITAASAHATTVLFNCTFTTPAIAVNAMCAASGSISGLLQGQRVTWVGGIVATAAVLTDGAGLSDVIASAGAIIGGESFVGSIGFDTGTADQASGTSQFFLHYVPMSDGAYAEANL